MKIKQLQENIGNELILYHGGKDLQYTYKDFKPSSKGRWEAGPGIYFTTHYETARKYAKGGKSVFRGYLKCPIRWLEDSETHYSEMIDFVETWVPRSKQKRIIDSIEDNVERMGEYVWTTILVNLCINDDALNKNGTIRLREWLIERGVDASYQTAMGNNEYWVVVFNPRVIRYVEKTVPNDVPVEEYVMSFNPNRC